jgi:hypothetical protein
MGTAVADRTHPSEGNRAAEGDEGDALWAVVCMGLSGAWIAFLLSPYALHTVVSSVTTQVIVGLIAGAICAGIGVFAISRRNKG